MKALCSVLDSEFGTAKVFRPYRDVRFCKDKTPNKTHQSAFVAAAPETGWYVELSAAGHRTGAGFYEATPTWLAALRAAIDDDRRGAEVEKLIALLEKKVWQPGVAHTLGLLGEAGADNVRLVSVDAVWAIEHLIEPGQLEELWTFFPDPWPKKRHHKRRLVNPAFAALAASRLRDGGRWRLATDWAEYADQMRVVLDAEEALKGGPVERWSDRPITKFERKGRAVHRPIHDFEYVKTSSGK